LARKRKETGRVLIVSINHIRQHLEYMQKRPTISYTSQFQDSSIIT
jgi:hypothetical protein